MPKAKQQRYFTVTATMPNGKRKYYRGRTLQEAEEKRHKDALELRLGVRVDDDTLFRDITHIWLGTKVDSGLHVKSLDTLTGMVNRYILPVLGDMKVREIQPYHIRTVLHKISHLSKGTQAKVLQYTRNILDIAVENSLIVRNPCLKTIKPGGARTKEVKPLTDEQCETLLKAVKNTRAWLFVMVLLYAGLRKGEALGLTWRDIDFGLNTLSVHRSIVYPVGNNKGEINKDCKTESSHRTIPMVSVLRTALYQAKKESNSVYVFSMDDGSFLSKSSYESMWGLIEARSIFSKTKRSYVKRTIDFPVHPHQLRHTCATRWIRSGMDPRQVMYLMGHSTMKMTMEIYAHYEEEIRRTEAIEYMEKMV